MHRALSLFAPAAVCGAFFACSSSSSPAPTASCSVALNGNVTESATGSVCGTIEPTTDDGGAADTMLTFQISSKDLSSLSIAISLGASPTAGSFSSENTTNWNVLGSSTASPTADDGGPGCVYSAGATVVPAGSFTLTITSIDPSGGAAHGTLDLTMYVHAASGVSCGIGNNEDVSITF